MKLETIQPVKKKKYQSNNPVVEIYRGHPVRKYGRINFRVNQFELKRFIDAKLDHRLSASEAIKKRLIFPCSPGAVIQTISNAKGN